ncbi:hypothetical protein SANT12839_086120 [Streptomyces antimycoticus]|uniref:Uncharacterized protein n=1 Tax=Streptomyces antimycoticus TaxID=68175 RepID=A0A4D4KM47_9ACTN|nr:hypothetical protein SANT12839_086120 [Streptomyces antimycoticus]
MFDDAGDADADAEDPRGVAPGRLQDLRDAVADMARDQFAVVAHPAPGPAGGQRPVGACPFGQREIEQLDTDPGLADIHPDHVAAVRRDAQEGAGSAAVGVDASGLLHQLLGEQFGDHIADGT